MPSLVGVVVGLLAYALVGTSDPALRLTTCHPSGTSDEGLAAWREGDPLPPAEVVDDGCLPVRVEPFDIARVAGQPRHVVDEVLGRPDRCEQIPASRRLSDPLYRRTAREHCEYRDGGIEITFFDGAADWITVHHPAGRFSPTTVSDFGFSVGVPAAINDYEMRWHDVAGIRDISLHAGGDPGPMMLVVRVSMPLQ